MRGGAGGVDMAGDMEGREGWIWQFISLIPHIYCRDPFTQFPFIPSHIRSSIRLRSRPSSFQSLYHSSYLSLISASSIFHLLYADDTQLFISFVPKNVSSAINNLQSTITLISSYMSSNYLTLNPSKTDPYYWSPSANV